MIVELSVSSMRSGTLACGTDVSFKDCINRCRETYRAEDKKGPVKGPLCLSCKLCRLTAVVEFEFDRVGRQAQAFNFFLLENHVTVDDIVSEHAARLEEIAILVQRLERLVQ